MNDPRQLSIKQEPLVRLLFDDTHSMEPALQDALKITLHSRHSHHNLTKRIDSFDRDELMKFFNEFLIVFRGAVHGAQSPLGNMYTDVLCYVTTTNWMDYYLGNEIYVYLPSTGKKMVITVKKPSLFRKGDTDFRDIFTLTGNCGAVSAALNELNKEHADLTFRNRANNQPAYAFDGRLLNTQ